MFRNGLIYWGINLETITWIFSSFSKERSVCLDTFHKIYEFSCANVCVVCVVREVKLAIEKLGQHTEYRAFSMVNQNHLTTRPNIFQHLRSVSVVIAANIHQVALKVLIHHLSFDCSKYLRAIQCIRSARNEMKKWDKHNKYKFYEICLLQSNQTSIWIKINGIFSFEFFITSVL